MNGARNLMRRHVTCADVKLISVCGRSRTALRRYFRCEIDFSFSFHTVQWILIIVIPPPIHRGRGIVFDRFVCLFLSFFLCQQDYEITAIPICMKFSGKVRSDHGMT